MNIEDLVLNPIRQGCLKRTITKIIIHHVAPDYRVGRYLTTEELDFWHEKNSLITPRKPEDVKFWRPEIKHIGYHYLIEPDGMIVAARHPNEKGCHCGRSSTQFGQNGVSLGVLLVSPGRGPQEQWDGLKRLGLCCKAHIPGVTFHGHNEFNHDKACPGFRVRDWINNGMEPLEGWITE